MLVLSCPWHTLALAKVELSLLILPPTPGPFSKLNAGSDLYRPLVKRTHQGLGGMSHYVDDMAISNHGNLPTQASVAPQT